MKNTTARAAHPGLGSRSAEILARLRGEMERGAYGAGEKLPTELQLCERFGVSRPTVRRAVAQLVEDGQVVVRKGAGIFVVAPSRATVDSKTVSVMWEFDAAQYLAIQQRVLESGHLLCAFSQSEEHWQPKAERLFLERVMDERHKGLVAFLSPVAPRNDDVVSKLARRGVRVVHAEPSGTELPSESYLMLDYERAGHIGAVELMIAGYSRVVYVSMADAPFETLQARGFAAAIRDHGGGYVPRRDRFTFPPGIDSSAPARKKVVKFLRSFDAPVGLYCRSPDLAAALMDIAREEGLDVPGDLGVLALSFGREDGAERGIDVVQFDRSAQVARAVDLVTAPDWRGVRELVAPKCIRRGTVAAISNGNRRG